MSTRSGKRIHNTVFENTEPVDSQVVVKHEKKSRNKRKRENDEHPDIPLQKSKNQKHYVSYPSEDDGGYTTANDVVDGNKYSRKSKKNTLKEHDLNVLENGVDAETEDKRRARITRHTRRFPDVDDAQNIEVQSEESLPKKDKKNKKKKSKHSDINENIPEPVQNDEVPKVSKKSKKKKKKGRHTNEEKQSLNKSNVSTDSFHSAAGSPLTTEDMEINHEEKMDTTLINEDEAKINKTSDKIHKKKKKAGNKPITPGDDTTEQEVESTMEIINEPKKSRKSSLKTDEKLEPDNDTIEKEITKKRKSSIKPAKENNDVSKISEKLNSTYDKIDIDDGNTTLEKIPKARRSLRLNNSTIENAVDTVNVDISDKLNATFEKDKLRSNIVLTENKNSPLLNTTFEKSSDKTLTKAISLDSTFDKSNPKLNTTFDKIESNTNSEKSSLISSDNSPINVTFDKDNSRISITSDDSKTENIVNTTPVLIESSMDESHLSMSRVSVSSETKDKEATISPTLKNTLQLPITPLKREGTFTKESSDIKTPTKRQTLPSPGYTPFNVTRSSNKEKNVLNITRSIEKSRRSSLADLAPTRQTRVMFCSPMNNPAVVLQERKKIIKSSMKGSNKSFVFDDSAASGRPAARKRSYTHNDADETRAKRTRLAYDTLLPTDRLARTRTTSAAAKLPETTPSKKATPSKPKSEPKRTRLPNFAALHQKQFDKMESLSDCQQRKMKRAKKLLVPKTPNGTVMVLERSSPRGTETKAKEAVTKKAVTPIKKPETPAKKPEMPAKKLEVASKINKLPTLESLRPGFTRFGFKMNTEFNPFSISKTDNKLKTNPEKNGLTAKFNFAPKTPVLTTKPLQTKQPTLPSLNGTTARKEAAKQAVMREKSFTSLSGKRDEKRKESRTIIKGVRTNRRFDLQMKMRNID